MEAAEPVTVLSCSCLVPGWSATGEHEARACQDCLLALAEGNQGADAHQGPQVVPAVLPGRATGSLRTAICWPGTEPTLACTWQFPEHEGTWPWAMPLVAEAARTPGSYSHSHARAGDPENHRLQDPVYGHMIYRHTTAAPPSTELGQTAAV